MLSSINPLVERSRDNRWSVTVAWYALGAIAAGAVFGAMLGSLGAGLTDIGVPRQPLIAGTLVAVVAGIGFDLGWARWPLPSPHRQVNERWLDTYRGWVYGVGFGAQLGVGVVTVVTTAAIYQTWAFALLSTSAWAGAAIGAVFGVVRFATMLWVRRVNDPIGLRTAIAGTQRWLPMARRVALSAQGVAAIVLLATL